MDVDVDVGLDVDVDVGVDVDVDVGVDGWKSRRVLDSG